MTADNKKKMKPLLISVQKKLGTAQRKGNALYPIVCAAIPENLRESIVFTRLNSSRLHIVTSTGGAASRLRFCQRAILEACAVLPEAPEFLTIKVAPGGNVRESAPEATLRSSTRPKQEMSEQAAAGVKQAADCVDDKRLREALHKLASHTRR